ncbi:hypothetical protein [Nocardia sp. NPDC050413]|uniref:hypothetical protein n=1 Tax=Nocardia sp. NPDC050413 TaxID=3155784 RepID=UPI0033D22DC1
MTRVGRSRSGAVKLLLGVAAIAFLVGGAATLVGLGGMTSDPDAVPTCDGKIMSVGDRCEITRRGSTVDSYTYQEKIERQQANKDSAGTTLTIGLTVIGASLLTGVLVEIRFRRSGPRRTSFAPAGSATPSPEVPSQRTEAAAPTRAGTVHVTRAVVITGVAAGLCVATAVVVGVVVVLADRPDSSEPTPSQAAAASSSAAYSRHIEALMAGMPATLRAGIEHCEPSPVRQRHVLRAGTCHLTKNSPLVAGLAAHDGLAGIFQVANVNATSYYKTMRYQGIAFRDDATGFAVFNQDQTPSDPPGLGNLMEYLDRRTGLWLNVSHLVTVQDAETFLARAGF